MTLNIPQHSGRRFLIIDTNVLAMAAASLRWGGGNSANTLP